MIFTKTKLKDVRIIEIKKHEDERRFFAWLKCGFRRTTISYERIIKNYFGLNSIASFLMYYRVLR